MSYENTISRIAIPTDEEGKVLTPYSIGDIHPTYRAVIKMLCNLAQLLNDEAQDNENYHIIVNELVPLQIEIQPDKENSDFTAFLENGPPEYMDFIATSLYPILKQNREFAVHRADIRYDGDTILMEFENPFTCLYAIAQLASTFSYKTGIYPVQSGHGFSPETKTKLKVCGTFKDAIDMGFDGAKLLPFDCNKIAQDLLMIAKRPFVEPPSICRIEDTANILN